MGCMTSDDWTDMADRYALSTRSISRAINPYATDDAPRNFETFFLNIAFAELPA